MYSTMREACGRLGANLAFTDFSTKDDRIGSELSTKELRYVVSDRGVLSAKQI